MFKNRSVQVLLLVFLYLVCSPILPGKSHELFYTISLLMKDLLLWVLPVTIFFFIAHVVSSFERKAPLFLLALFGFEFFSNGISTWYAYGCAQIAGTHLEAIGANEWSSDFSALFRIVSKPSWWSAGKGTLLGVAAGLFASFFSPAMNRWIALGKAAAEALLTRFFAKLIPLFVLGFIAKMVHTHLLSQMVSQYGILLLWLLLFLSVYLCFLFFLSGGLKWREHFKNLLPAGGLAFSSGCSLSTMPWTIEGTGKNLKNPDLAKAIIPATTNIQQIGDVIINCFLCFLIYRQFNGVNPDIWTWMHFSLVFVLARFGTAAVLGGAIFIMIPIYEAQLGFTPEMIAIILAFNVILDPIVTSANVMANGALCAVFEKVWRKLFHKNELASIRKE